MSRMTAGRVGAWGFVSKSVVLCRLLYRYLAENVALAPTEVYGWTWNEPLSFEGAVCVDALLFFSSSHHEEQ